MSATWSVLRWSVSVALVAGVAALSRVPVTFSTPDQAHLRLSWGISGVPLRACRPLSPEELERLPPHMRNPKACIGRIAPYALDVRVDGRPALADTVRPGGVHGDRPVYVLADLPVAPGPHQVVVGFRALLPEGAPIPEGPDSLGWKGTVTMGPREVALVTLDEDEGRLVLRQEGR